MILSKALKKEKLSMKDIETMDHETLIELAKKCQIKTDRKSKVFFVYCLCVIIFLIACF